MVFVFFSRVHLFFLAVFLSFVTSGYVYAAPCESDAKEGYIFQNPIKYCSLEELLLGLVDQITIILMPVIVLGIVYIGFRMVWAGREKNADYSRWKKAFAWSLVGLFLVLGARGILSVIQNYGKSDIGRRV